MTSPFGENTMNDNLSNLSQWLMNNGGPVVRYRTAKEILRDESMSNISNLEQALFDCSLVKMWLERLKHIMAIQGSGNDRFENVVGKLLEFGLTKNNGELYDRLRSDLQYLKDQPENQSFIMSLLNSIIIAAGLARSEIVDSSLYSFMLRRLKALFQSTQQADYYRYVDSGPHASIPIQQRDRYSKDSSQGDLQLPCIHDIYLLSALKSIPKNNEIEEMIEHVILYVLKPEYQLLKEGNIYVRDERQGDLWYSFLIWKADLPGYFNLSFVEDQINYLVQRMELMAHFPTAISHDWFKRCFNHMEEFVTSSGTYVFPREYLLEKEIGNWVTGAHMGIEENRHSKKAFEIESTFRMLKIKSLIQQNTTEQ